MGQTVRAWRERNQNERGKVKRRIRQKSKGGEGSEQKGKTLGMEDGEA